MSPMQRQKRADRAASKMAARASSRRAVLGRFARQIHLDEHVQTTSRRARGFIEFLDQRRAINRLDDVESGGFFGLVRLQVSDQMPAQGEIGGLVHLEQRFLDLVLAEVDLTGIGGSAHELGGKGFGNGDEANRGRDRARPGRLPARCAREHLPTGP